MISKEDIERYAYSQIIHISKFGCSGIKCKKCVLNKICDHFPSKSKDVANQMIAYAKTVGE
jgi:hypothetical protein